MNNSVECYKLWYVVNNKGSNIIPEERRACITKTCAEECGCFLIKCRDDLKRLLTEEEINKEFQIMSKIELQEVC